MYTIVIIPYKHFFDNYKGKEYKMRIPYIARTPRIKDKYEQKCCRKIKNYKIYSERVFTNLFSYVKILLKIKEVRYGQKSTPYR